MALGKNLKSADKPAKKTDVRSSTKKETAEATDWTEAAELDRLNEDLSARSEKKDLELLMVFPLGRESYALPIGRVKEVVKTPNIAPLPQSPDYIVGVVNIRGNVMAAIDLRNKLSGEAAAGKQQEFIVVLKEETFQAGLLVEQVPDTIVVEASQISTSSALIKNLAAEDRFIKGIVKKDGKMIILIDVTELFKTEENK